MRPIACCAFASPRPAFSCTRFTYGCESSLAQALITSEQSTQMAAFDQIARPRGTDPVVATSTRVIVQPFRFLGIGTAGQPEPRWPVSIGASAGTIEQRLYHGRLMPVRSESSACWSKTAAFGPENASNGPAAHGSGCRRSQQKAADRGSFLRMD